MTVANVNVCGPADSMSMPALVPADDGLEVAMTPSSVLHTAPEAAPSVDPTPAPAGTNVTGIDASMPVMLHVAAAPVLVANPMIAVGAGAPVPCHPIRLGEQALICLLTANGSGTWDRLNVRDVNCLYAANKRMAHHIGCWPWHQPSDFDSVPRQLFNSRYGWQQDGTFRYHPVHQAAMRAMHAINPAVQLSFAGGQVMYTNIEATTVAMHEQFRATQARTG